MKSYHFSWLGVHPHRSEEWLKEKMAEGFDIHHLDGDHANDDPKNLVLIECLDHLRLHGRELNRLDRRKHKKPKAPEKPKDEKRRATALAVWERRRAASIQ
ncbi:MAG: hypothetical protein LLG15_07660 [Betaproteobacteria bacterium]|nr:hypothetical protein [Betaproteobacteria bacterium]